MDENDRSAPATKGDLAVVKADISAVKEDIYAVKADISAVKGDISAVLEAVRDTETKLLNAFYGYAKSNDKRVYETEANEALLRGRMAVLESRMTDLEERLNRSPQH